MKEGKIRSLRPASSVRSYLKDGLTPCPIPVVTGDSEREASLPHAKDTGHRENLPQVLQLAGDSGCGVKRGEPQGLSAIPHSISQQCLSACTVGPLFTQ